MPLKRVSETQDVTNIYQIGRRNQRQYPKLPYGRCSEIAAEAGLSLALLRSARLLAQRVPPPTYRQLTRLLSQLGLRTTPTWFICLLPAPVADWDALIRETAARRWSTHDLKRAIIARYGRRRWTAGRKPTIPSGWPEYREELWRQVQRLQKLLQNRPGAADPGKHRLLKELDELGSLLDRLDGLLTPSIQPLDSNPSKRPKKSRLLRQNR
jgi:hypothetical protein